MTLTKKNLNRCGALSLTLVMALLIGCSEDNGGGVYNYANDPDSCPKDTIQRRPAHCCDASMQLKPPPLPTECNDPGFSPSAVVTSSLGRVADASVAGGRAVEIAASMESSAPTVGNSASRSAATAVDGPKVKPAQTAAGNQNLAGPLHGTETNSGTTGGASGEGAGGGSAGGGGGNLSVETRSALATTERQLLPSEAAAAAYAGGGAGGGRAKGSGAGGGFDFGALGGNKNGAGGSGMGTLEMGGRGAAASASGPMGSADPEDYFERLKPGDSIFKIVEKRYGAKATNWALGDAAKAAAQSKKMAR